MKQIILLAAITLTTSLFADDSPLLEGIKEYETVIIESVPNTTPPIGCYDESSWSAKELYSRDDISFEKAVEIASLDKQVTHFTFVTLEPGQWCALELADQNSPVRWLLSGEVYFFKGEPELTSFDDDAKGIAHSYIVKRKKVNHEKITP